MKKKYYHRKLVRDKIPEIIKRNRDSYEARILGKMEHRKLLRKKLIEEAEELLDASKGEILNELSDVLELVKSIAEFEGFNLKDVEVQRKKKEKKAGAFKKRIFLIWSNKPAGSK